ncbi:MAG: replication initiation protein [Sulfurimonas sp.]|nr:replication initiation protein [Sulfurimonas sp.]MBU3939601.1 replication initiation protein [bacterium]MBU4003006.1 replication initiation protein [Pseudomonadota bacterium]
MTENKNSIKKANPLIQIYATLSLNEQKIFNYIIYCIRNDMLSKDNKLALSHSQINKFLNQKLNSLQIKSNFKNLQSVVVELGVEVGNRNYDENWELIGLIAHAKSINGIVEIRLEQELIKLVLDPSKFSYTTLDFNIINLAKSRYTIRLYENLRSFMNYKKKYLHFPQIDIFTFKKLMGIDKINTYNQFSSIRRKVIDVAVAEINTITDINIDSYELIKQDRGKSITHIKFHTSFKSNDNFSKEQIMSYENKNFLIFVDDYLPLYANKKEIGKINSHKVIFNAQNNSLTMQDTYGKNTLNPTSRWQILNDCYKNRKKFDWFNEENFTNILHNEYQKEKSEQFQNSMRID